MDLLKLIALNETDLAVLSAHFQDALVKPVDLAYLPKEQRFALMAYRFDWQAPQTPRRRLAAMHFERVLQCQFMNLDLSASEPLNLLALTFHIENDPSGFVVLHFSQDKAIRLKVECLEAQMKDLGAIWEAQSQPVHQEA